MVETRELNIRVRECTVPGHAKYKEVMHVHIIKFEYCEHGALLSASCRPCGRFEVNSGKGHE